VLANASQVSERQRVIRARHCEPSFRASSVFGGNWDSAGTQMKKPLSAGIALWRVIMHRLQYALLAGVAVVGFTAVASAAELPVYKAPVVAVADWNGFYGTGILDYSWGTSRNTFNFNDTETIGGAPFNASASGTYSNRVTGMSAGMGTGYRVQTGRFVMGGEIDAEYCGERGSGTLGTSVSISDGDNNPMSIATTTRCNWFTTARLSGGVLPTNDVLVYATGGPAMGGLKITGNGQAANVQTAPPPIPNQPFNLSGSATKVGFSFGGGIEDRLTRSWILRFEYLYMNLGKVTATGAVAAGCLGMTGPTCTSAPTSASVTGSFFDNMIRAALIYQFEH
jgi:outer membrane immunogenic protein